MDWGRRERETADVVHFLQSKVVRQARNPTIQGHLPSNWVLDGRYHRMALGRPGVCLKRLVWVCCSRFGGPLEIKTWHGSCSEALPVTVLRGVRCTKYSYCGHEFLGEMYLR